MDNMKNDRYYIQQIRQDAEFIVEHMKDIDIDGLNKDEVLLDSMMFRMIQISENAKKLTEGYINEHVNVPWHALVGMRNKIVHDYGNVNLSIVYDTLKEDIPALIEQIKDL